MKNNLTSDLSQLGYWPARAREFLENKQYFRAVELCTDNLKNEPEILSGRIVLAIALYCSNQKEEAEEQFYRILQSDPDNITALKYLGDLKFKAGDENLAFSYYNRVLQLDKFNTGLQCPLNGFSTKETKVLTLKRESEKSDKNPERLRKLPFQTETAADLLSLQGHTRMAREIYQDLLKINKSPKLIEKLEKISSNKNED